MGKMLFTSEYNLEKLFYLKKLVHLIISFRKEKELIAGIEDEFSFCFAVAGGKFLSALFCLAMGR